MGIVCSDNTDFFEIVQPLKKEESLPLHRREPLVAVGVYEIIFVDAKIINFL